MTSSSSRPPNPRVVKTILLISSFVAMLNETSINVALSPLMSAFGVTVTTVQWLVTGFMLVMAVIVPTTAHLQGRFSTRRLYFSSLALLVVGSLLAGLAPVFALLLAGRLIQAAGTCVLMTLTVTTVMQLTPPEGRGGAMGLVSLVSLFAPAIAPTLGGLILQFWGWNWIFLAALPLLLVILVVAALFLDNVTEPRTDRLDLGSVVLSLVGFGGLLLGLGNLDLWPTQPWFIGVSLLLGGFGLVGFVARQMTLPNPLLNLRVFEYRQFSLAMIFVFVSIVSVFGLTMLTPMALGQVWGLGTAAAGLAMLPGGLLNGFTAPLFGKLYDQFGPRGLAIAGSVAMVGAMGALVFLPATAPFWFYIGLHVLFLLGTSSVMTVNQANGVNALPQRLFPHGTAVMSTLMQLGGGVGTALYISVLASGHAKPAVEAFQGTFLWGAALLLVPLVTSFFVKKSVHPEG